MSDTSKSPNAMLEMAGHNHLPAWFKVIMATVIVPPLVVVLSFFFLTKFTGLENEFKMIAEGYAYNLTGGPVNKESTEMGKMVEIMSDQLTVINQLRLENATFRDEMLEGVNRIAGQVDGINNRLTTLETWAIRHSDNGNIKFGAD